MNQIPGRIWTAIGGAALVAVGAGLATLGIALLFPLVFEWWVRILWFSVDGTAESLNTTVMGFACLAGGVAILGGGWALLAKSLITHTVTSDQGPEPDDGLDVFSSLAPRDE